ncbi:MAG: hypothetical protein IPF63_06165 [Bacteroidetes bacterium]|nr:hypothetical protein [Bacteroidota bacterium]
MAKLILIGIGGTGARVMRAFTFMLAGGVDLGDITEIVPCIIDTDKTNGDTTICKNLINRYNSLQNILNFNEVSLFNKKFAGDKSYHLNDNEYDKTFSSFINNISFNNIKKDFIRTLYNDSPSNNPETELNLNLKEGFKGNPNIGAVVFNTVNIDELPALADGDRIFFISSIFGGTGASGFPTLLKKIRTDAEGNIRDTYVNAIKGGISVQPYFNVKPDANKTINAKKFVSKTKSALSYYETDGAINSLNALYYIGDASWDKDDTNKLENNEGKEHQQNPAHIIDFLAATAIVDFAKAPIKTFKKDINDKPIIYKEISIHGLGDDRIVRLNNFSTDFLNIKLKPLVKLAILCKLFKNKSKIENTTFHIGLNIFFDKEFQNFNAFLLNFEKWHSELSDIRNYTKASFFNLVNDDDWSNFFDGIDDKNQLNIAVKPNLLQLLKYDISKKLNTFYDGVNQANDINKNFNETISSLLMI